MSPKVSIIVPIYNAEENLARCIESVLKQDYREFELLLMDDGSRDSSGEICDSFAKEDARVRVIHKENTGVSDTRNQALALAKGEYIQFLDSDDWITTDATELLVRSAKEHDCDMVIADFYRVIGERLAHKGDIQEDGLLTREEFAAYMMENPADFYYGVLWNKLYRRDIIEKNQLTMEAEISWCEDFIFNMEYIRHVKSVYALQVPIYYYVKTEGSLVSQSSSISKVIQMKRSVFKCYHEFYRDIFNQEDYEKNRMRVYRFLVAAAGDGAVMPAVLPGSMRLGDERISVSMEVNESGGILMEAYRERKLLERFLETVALKQDLGLEEVKLLLYLSQADEICTLKEIAEAIHCNRARLLLAIQKLTSREILKSVDWKSMEDKEESENKIFPSKVDLKFLPEAEAVLRDLYHAQSQYEEALYEGFSEEELEQYEILSERICSNAQRALK